MRRQVYILFVCLLFVCSSKGQGIILNIPAPFNNDAMTLFPFIIGKDMDSVTVNHERIHFSQQLEMLVVPFYLWYVIEWAIKKIKWGSDSYLHISFEKEAFANAVNMKYRKHRKHYRWVKYL